MQNKGISGTIALNNKREIFRIEATKKDETLKTKVAAYARVSSNSEDQLNSFASQIRYYTNLIEENKSWELVEIYADESVTGVSTEKRDDFNRMIRDCKDGKIDRIITKSTSRFSRNTLDSIKTIRELKDIGVSVHFEKEGIDTATLSGENLLTLYSLFAQEESISISQNCKKGNRMRMKKGTYVSSNPAYGYRLVDKELVIYEPEAEIVRRIFREYLEGRGVIEIAKGLSCDKIPSKVGKTNWRHQTISEVIRNERYIGDMLMQKSFNEDVLPFKQRNNIGDLPKYYVKDTHEPIIDKIQFKLANMLLDERANIVNTKYQDYTYSKKIKCKECGTTYRRKFDKNIVYWVCRVHDDSKIDCSSERIKEELINRAFVKMYNKLKENYKTILLQIVQKLKKLQELEQRENVELREINIKIAEITEQIHVMTGLLSKGILDSALFISQSDEIKKQLIGTKKEKSKILGKMQKDIILEDTEFLIDAIEEFPEYLTEMDTDIFSEIIEKIHAKDNGTIEFELKNKLILTERL